MPLLRYTYCDGLCELHREGSRALTFCYCTHICLVVFLFAGVGFSGPAVDGCALQATAARGGDTSAADSTARQRRRGNGTESR